MGPRLLIAVGEHRVAYPVSQIVEEFNHPSIRHLIRLPHSPQPMMTRWTAMCSKRPSDASREWHGSGRSSDQVGVVEGLLEGFGGGWVGGSAAQVDILGDGDLGLP